MNNPNQQYRIHKVNPRNKHPIIPYVKYKMKEFTSLPIYCRIKGKGKISKSVRKDYINLSSGEFSPHYNFKDFIKMAEKIAFQRRRSTSRWSPTHSYSSTESFLSSPVAEGLNTIHIRDRHIDFLVKNRKSAVTLVSFHGDLSMRAKTIPYFMGTNMTESAGINLVAVSDSSLELGPISVAWFLGDRQLGHLRPVLKPLLEHILTELNTERLIIFGASGGGYAAVNFAQDFPGSICFVMNPRLNLEGNPTPNMSGYLEHCHNAMTITPKRRIRRTFISANMADSLQQRLDFDLLILQNKKDGRYLRGQVQPFVQSLLGSSGLYTKYFSRGEGHTPAAREDLVDILNELANLEKPQKDAIISAGFSSPAHP